MKKTIALLAAVPLFTLCGRASGPSPEGRGSVRERASAALWSTRLAGKQILADRLTNGQQLAAPSDSVTLD